MSPVVAALVMTAIVVILVVGIYVGILRPELLAEAQTIVECMICSRTPSTCSGCE